MQLNKPFLAIVNGQTDRITDICDSRVAFATENIENKVLRRILSVEDPPLHPPMSLKCGQIWPHLAVTDVQMTRDRDFNVLKIQ